MKRYEPASWHGTSSLSYQIVWSESAVERIEEILDFLVEEQEPSAARRIVDDLLDRVQILADFPRMGRALHDEVEPDLRRFVLGEYVLLYRVEEMTQTISIGAVRHFRQRSLRGEDL